MVIQWPFMSYFFFPFSYKIAKNWKQRKKFSFHLIQIFKSWASQNDHQILSFLIRVYGWLKSSLYFHIKLCHYSFYKGSRIGLASLIWACSEHRIVLSLLKTNKFLISELKTSKTHPWLLRTTAYWRQWTWRQ